MGVKGSEYDGYVHVMKVGMVDLCKCDGFISGLIGESHSVEKNEGKTPCMFYSEPGVGRYRNDEEKEVEAEVFDIAVTEDYYGDKMYCVDPKKVLKALIKSNKKEKYRRYEMAIAVLRKFIEWFDDEKAVVMFFGY